MSAIMAGVNAILGVTFDLLLFPFRQLHPMVGLTVVSAIAAVLMLLGYRATSNQPAVEAVKRKIAAGLFEIRLFNARKRRSSDTTSSTCGSTSCPCSG